MSITGAELLAIVAVRGADEAALKLVEVGSAADSAGAKLGALAVGATVLAGAALVGIGVASIKMAGDFQQGVNRLVTGAGDVTDNMKLMGQSILGVSVATGVMTGPLNAAMYLIISSGQRGAQAIDTLSVASKGAVIEQAKVADVANVLSGVMTNYGTKTYNATQFMNGLIVAVQQGKITLQDLSVAMGPLDPIARNLGISFNDVAAAMTTQTNAMIPAARAATGLRFMMQALENPTKKAIAAMQEWGLSSVDVANEMKVSLPGALQMIYDAAKRAGPEGSVPFNRAFQDMVGGMRSWSTASALVGSHMKDFVRNSQLIKVAMEQNKTGVIGWTVAQGNFNVQMDRGKAALAALAISIGQQLLPYVTRLVQWIIPLIVQFTDWVVKNNVVEKSLLAVGAAISTTVGFIQNMVAIGIAVVTFFQQNAWAAAALGVAIGALGGVMTLFAASSVANMILSLLDYGLSMLTAVAETVTGAAVMSSTFGTMSGMIIASMGAAASSILATLGPFLLAGAVIAAVSIGVILAIQHWGEISAWLQTTWSAVIDWFNGAIQTIGTAVQSVINWFIQWQVPIEVVGGLILTFFAPALIMAGTQAVIAGVQIATSFIVSLVQSGLAATISAAQISGSFLVSIIATGTQAVISAGMITVSFIASMFQAGVQAVISAGQITFSFVASIIATGVEGWIAVAKLAPLVVAMIATGVQATIAGVAIAGRFIVALIASGVEALIAGGRLTIGYVGGLIAAAATAQITAATLTTTIIPALYATGAAATAAAGVIGVAALIILGTFLLIQNGALNMDKSVQTSTGEMVQANQIRFRQMAGTAQATSSQMQTSVSNSANQMKTNVSSSVATMGTNVEGSTRRMKEKAAADIASFADQALAKLSLLDNQGGSIIQHFGAAAMRVFDEMKSSGISDLSQLDASALSYLREIQGYVDAMNGQLNLVASNAASRGLGPGRINMHAEGTDFAPGGLSLVGERGPELLNIPRGAQIIPNHQLGSISSGANAQRPIQLNVDVYLDGARTTRQLMPHIVSQIRAATGTKL